MTLKQALVAVVPESLRPRLREIYQSTTDRADVLLGRRDPLTPPKRMWHLITSPDLDFKSEGEGLRRFLIESVELAPHESVLDVGCGIGRNAVPLIGHVKEYHGFDIMADAVQWCQKNITPRHSNFHFELADVYNKSYNPDGKHQAFEYRFPYPDAKFDLVFLVSVFTHMLYQDVENYLAEIARVLKPGGRCAISYLLLNDEARKNMATGLGAFDFKYKLDKCYAQHEAMPEAAIGYDEEVIRDLYAKCGLEIREPIRYGTWSKTKVMMQDMVIAQKGQ